MPRATHLVGSRFFTYGEWREPGTPVDASAWPNRQVLEESHYLVPIPAQEQGGVATAAPSVAAVIPSPQEALAKSKSSRQRRKAR
jgi:hypothetical protein